MSNIIVYHPGVINQVNIKQVDICNHIALGYIKPKIYIEPKIY